MQADAVAAADTVAPLAGIFLRKAGMTGSEEGCGEI